jgi:hypothetical protein
MPSLSSPDSKYWEEIPLDRDKATVLLCSKFPGLDPSIIELLRKTFDFVVNTPVFEWFYIDDSDPFNILSKAVSIQMMPLSAAARQPGLSFCIYDLVVDGQSARQGHNLQTTGTIMTRVAQVPFSSHIRRRRDEKIDQILGY